MYPPPASHSPPALPPPPRLPAPRAARDGAPFVSSCFSMVYLTYLSRKGNPLVSLSFWICSSLEGHAYTARHVT